MAKPRPIPGFAEVPSFREAAAAAVEVRSEEVFEHSEGVLRMNEIERVHDMRVASRRLRAALEIFAPCFPKSAHRAALREVKALADDLGQRRDRDVQIEELERIARTLTAEDRAGIGELIRTLRADQEGANALLAEALERIERDGLRTRLLALVEEAALR